MALRVEGMENLIQEIEKIEKQIVKKEAMALRAGAKPLSRAMKQYVARSKKHQKHIQEDIHISNVKGKEGVRWIEVGPGKKTNWRAKFVEFGTSKMSARPFMEPAQMTSKEEVLKNMEQVMKTGIAH